MTRSLHDGGSSSADPRQPFERPRLFLATPFSPGSAGGEDPDTFDRVQAHVTEAARIAEVDLIHPKAIRQAGVILDQIFERIDEADVVVAIITGNNPNVLFEVGYSASRAPILLAADTERLPFDLRIYRVLTYGQPGELDTLTHRLADAIRETLEPIVGQTDAAIAEYAEAMRHIAGAMTSRPPWMPPTAPRTFEALFVPVPLQVEGGPTGRRAVEPSSFFASQPGVETPGCSTVSGLAGSGKSTLLRFLAFHAWTSPAAIGLDRPHLPLLVSAAALAQARGASVSERLRSALTLERGLALNRPPPENFVTAWSRRSRRPWLILLDALDQVPQAAQRELQEWLAVFVPWCARHGCRVVAATREFSGSAIAPSEHARVVRMLPLDAEASKVFSERLLGPEAAGPFLLAAEKSRLLYRLGTPLWLGMVAGRFARAGDVPLKRVEVMESAIAACVARAQQSAHWHGTDARVVASARALLERLAGPEKDFEAITRQFLANELQMSPAEAAGSARQALKVLADGTGLLVEFDSGWVFVNPAVLEHLTAAAMLRVPALRARLDILVEQWWRSDDRREVVLAVLGLLDDSKELNGLLRRVFAGSGLRAVLRLEPCDSLERARFLVDCVLDGIAVDTKLRRALEARLRRHAAEPRDGAAAAELLGLLGDCSALEAWVREKGRSEEGAIYALASLVHLGEIDTIERMLRDATLPAGTRAKALLVLPMGRRVARAAELMDKDDEIAACAAFVLAGSPDPEPLERALRSGNISAAAMDTLLISAADRKRLETLFRVVHDESVPASTREAIQARLPAAAMWVLKSIASDPAAGRPTRLAADWLLGEVEDCPDLSPLFTWKALVPAELFVFGHLAVRRDSRSLTKFAANSQVPERLRLFAVEVTAQNDEWDAVEELVLDESAAPEVRIFALRRIGEEDQARALELASRLRESPTMSSGGRES